jgi:hypothetical protein
MEGVQEGMKRIWTLRQNQVGLQPGTDTPDLTTVAIPWTTARAIQNTQAGWITSIVGTPRQIQFGLKFVF